MTESVHARGLKTYGEALEDHRPSLGDDMAMRRYADIPMGAMWTMPKNAPPAATYAADLKGASSVAHVYGRPLVAAESMTSALAPWAYAPRDLRRVADAEFALGVNRIVIHSSVHQPLVGKAPGLTLFIFGQYFNRNETWAERNAPDEKIVTTFVFNVRNIPAALYKALGGFATNGINMTKLESYQLGGRFVATQFYADIEGHPADAHVRRALEELRFFSEKVRILGVYKGHPMRGDL